MGMLSRLLNPLSPGRAILGALDPGRAYKSAMGPMQQQYEQAQSYMSPYAQQGQQAYAPMSTAMNRLLNPEQLHGEWIQNYETSPYAQSVAAQAQQSGLNAASSMGLLGSTPALQALQGGTANIVARDRDNYLNNLMQKYMAGAQMAQGLYGQGANMSGMMGQAALNHGQNMGSLAYGQLASRSNLLQDLLGRGVGAIGTAMGSPVGGFAAGLKAFGNMGG